MDGGDDQQPPAQASTEHGGEDLISRLPDCILGEIVTRLPTADAVRVQVLSTRWRHAWASSPLNLDLDDGGGRYYYRLQYLHLMPDILSAHPGAARRLKLDYSASGHFAHLYNRWLWSPALNGLQELEIDPGRSCSCDSYAARDSTRPLPARALRFAPTLRVLRLGHLTFPSAAAAAALRFPHLELLSLLHVDISEGALHGVLAAAGCPVLRTLVIDDCTGFATVRINSPTITSFAVSALQSYWSLPEGTLRQVIVEDAPLLEKMVTFRSGVRGVACESFELRVVSAPRLRVLGSLSKMTSKIVLGATVFAATSRRVNLVEHEFVRREKRSLMHAVAIATTLRTVKVLALEDVDCVDEVINFLRCFPCLEKLYVSVSSGFRSVGSYDKLNPIECLESHLKMVAINQYQDKRSHAKLARFFVTTARVLELLKVKPGAHQFHGFVTKEWIVDQQRQLQAVRNMASPNVKFHFVPEPSYQDVYCGTSYIGDLPVLISDSSRDDPFDQWFES